MSAVPATAPRQDPTAPRRDSALDGLRTIAIWLMASSHVARLVQRKIRPEWFDHAVKMDALTQALFLSLVGASLVMSLANLRHRSPGPGVDQRWMRGHVRRAGQLYLISFTLFFAEYGWQWPHSLSNNGILAVIALAILMFAPIVRTSRPVLGALVLGALLAGLAGWLDQRGLQRLPLNMGNAPLLPNLALTAFGVIAATGLLRRDARIIVPLAAVSVVAGALTLWRVGYPGVLDEPFGRTTSDIWYMGTGTGPENLWAMATGDALQPRKVGYFNPSPRLEPLMCGAIVVMYAALAALRPLVDRAWPTVLLVGRHSLQVYVFHLILVAIPVVVAGNRPLTTGYQGNAYFAAVMLACYGLAWWLERRRTRARAAA